MGGELGERALQDKPVDQPDQPDLLDRGDEFAASDEPAVFAHSQQALEIIDLARTRAHHRLESEEQSFLLERIANRLPDRRIAPLPARRRRGSPVLHQPPRANRAPDKIPPTQQQRAGAAARVASGRPNSLRRTAAGSAPVRSAEPLKGRQYSRTGPT